MNGRIATIALVCLVGSFAHANGPPLSPGGLKSIATKWQASNNTRVDIAPGLEVTFILEERAPLRPVTGDETEVDLRLRRVLDEAERRYWRRRVETRTMIDDSWYPEDAGWVDQDGTLVPARMPWWIW